MSSGSGSSGDRRPGSEAAESVVLVTGATGGIGSAVAARFAARGAVVVALGRRRDALDDLKTRLRGDAAAVHTVRADLRDDDDLDAASGRIEEVVAGVDVVVHAAGVFLRRRLARTDPEEFDDIFRVNTRARFVLTRRLLPLLRARRGQVVFVNSSLGLRSRAGVGVYAGTMHAGRALADALREEVNEDRIRVLSVYLGRTATPMQEKIHELEGRPYRPGRLIQPETVAETIFYASTIPPDAEITDLTVRPMQKPPPPGEDAAVG